MNIELKNLEVNERDSHETYCFKARLIISGQDCGGVFNHGKGGDHVYESNHLDSMVQAPKGNGYEYLEVIINELIADYLDEKTFARAYKQMD